MVNPKRNKFNKVIKKISKNKLGETDLLSSDLVSKIGNLEDRVKITIRLDSRIIEEAKNEAEKIGHGASYQRIINDHLLRIYGLEGQNNEQGTESVFTKLLKELLDMKKRIEVLEKKKA